MEGGKQKKSQQEAFSSILMKGTNFYLSNQDRTLKVDVFSIYLLKISTWGKQILWNKFKLKKNNTRIKVTI